MCIRNKYMETKPVIYWFRRDLRLSDLPGLLAATSEGREVMPCFILDDDAAGEHATGAASRWWLHHSLASLDSDIRKLGGGLLLRQGDSLSELRSLLTETGADRVYCSRRYEPWAAQQEQQLFTALERDGVLLKRFPGTLLWQPEQVLNQAGLPFKVFTPFWKRCLQLPTPSLPMGVPDDLRFASTENPGLELDDLQLLPRNPNWAAHWNQLWTPGEAGARRRLASFLDHGIDDYNEGRNHPAQEKTSKLSAHVAFGEISPRQLWDAMQPLRVSGQNSCKQADKFLSEMGWREFSHHLLHHFPTLIEQPFKPGFANFPWSGKQEHLAIWQKGLTGYPVVDAGMRELWHTGYMHNRVRMIVASFLTKHLLLPWQLGEAWFRNTLVDADLANNSCGWQWVAGSGADAAPYFRIFNPTLQGEKFDKAGDYVRRWVPELAALPDKYLHEPAKAPAAVLEEAGVVLDQTYPEPIVEHRAAREAALAAFQSIKAA